VPITRQASTCLLSLCILAVVANAAEPPSIVTTCVACHGARGEGNEAIGAPALAGQHPTYLAAQLADFKAGRRGYDASDIGGATMRGVALALDDADIPSLAAYYGGLPASDHRRSTRLQGDAKTGQALYEGSCAACHGMRAEGFPQLSTPNLRILPGWYIARQVLGYKKGWRGAPDHSGQPALWMRSVSFHIDEQAELADVVAYLDNLSAAAPL
jgi:cytochrome c oxidase subunit 2